jgi:hypothetical protein
MDTVPLVSPAVAGPLDLANLPRLWLRLSLRAAGFLPCEGDEQAKRLDRMTLETARVDGLAIERFVRERKPAYIEFERWVSEHGDLGDAERVARHNAIVRSSVSDAAAWDPASSEIVSLLDQVHAKLLDAVAADAELQANPFLTVV